MRSGGSRHDDEALLDLLGRALAPPPAEPSWPEVAALHRAVDASVARRGGARRRRWLPAGAAGALAVASVVLAASGGGGGGAPTGTLVTDSRPAAPGPGATHSTALPQATTPPVLVPGAGDPDELEHPTTARTPDRTSAPSAVTTVAPSPAAPASTPPPSTPVSPPTTDDEVDEHEEVDEVEDHSGSVEQPSGDGLTPTTSADVSAYDTDEASDDTTDGTTDDATEYESDDALDGTATSDTEATVLGAA